VIAYLLALLIGIVAGLRISGGFASTTRGSPS
jgi:hypothetical protein